MLDGIGVKDRATIEIVVVIGRVSKEFKNFKDMIEGETLFKDWCRVGRKLIFGDEENADRAKR